MMKKIMAVTLVTLSIGLASAQAEEVHTLSLGYAQSVVKIDSHRWDNDPKGINLKYRYEMNQSIGVITSFTYTQRDNSTQRYNSDGTQANLDYYAFNVGPAWRFNESLSAYVMLGLAHGEAKTDSISTDKTGMSSSVGLQFNPATNFTLDASVEYAKLDVAQVSTWILGMGYRF